MICVEEVIECPTSILKAQAVVGTGKGEEEINAETLAVQSNASFAGEMKANDIPIAGQPECEMVVSGSLTTGSFR